MMKRQFLALSRRYQAALHQHLQQGPKQCAQLAHQLGEQAAMLGMEKMELARMHEASLAAWGLSGNSLATRGPIGRQASVFFNVASKAIKQIRRAEMKYAPRLDPTDNSLNRRAAQLSETNRHLKQGIIESKTAEETLRKGGRHYAKLLRESYHLQKTLRRLIRQLLSSQEAERKKISLELQDGVAQTLLGIHVRLLTLTATAQGDTANLGKEIAITQRVVEESVQFINRFAHALKMRQRP